MGIATAERTYGPGDAVYREGEYGDALYVLTSGVLKLFRPTPAAKRRRLRLLKTWDIFGHLAFAGEARQRAYAEAVTQCRVKKVPKVFVERAIRQEPRVAFKMMTLLELRLVQYEELVKCLLPRETEVRLANLLPILAKEVRREPGRARHDRPAPHPPGSRSDGRLHPEVGHEGSERDAQSGPHRSESGRITLKDTRVLTELSRP
jgi:CRP/FNR family transcriptional regulator